MAKNENKKGKKRKSHEVVEIADDAQANTGGGFPHDKFHNRLDEASVSYFTEVKGTFDALEDDEERGHLVTNVLEEASGRELQVATDAACSRVLEALIPHAEPSSLFRFFHAFGEDGKLLTLACNAFGSHVLEKVLGVVNSWLLDGEGEPSSQEMLENMVQEVADKLYEFVTDRYGSHVVRRLLCILAGRDVLPAQSVSNAKDGATWLGGSKGGQTAGLGAKLGNSRGGFNGSEVHGPVYPELLTVLVEKLLSEDYAGCLVEELPFSQYGSPFLQALLLAVKGDMKLTQQLIPRLLGGSGAKPAVGSTAVLGDVDPTFVVAMAKDQNASHLVEAIIMHAPAAMQTDLEARVLRGNLALLSLHPRANYVVQAALGTLTTPGQVKGAVKELKGVLPQLLLGNRGGVVVALVAAVAGTHAAEIEVCQLIASALAQHTVQVEGVEMGLAEKLVTLGVPLRLADVGPHARLSVLGCALLARLLTFSPEASGPFATSIAALPEKELIALGSDSAGSRVLEAYLEGSGPAKGKRRVLRKLEGSYGTLAALPGGCHVVEKCYAFAGLENKEVIAKELAAAQPGLKEAYRTLTLLRKCNVDDYKRSPEIWRKRVSAKLAMQKEYGNLLNIAPAAAKPTARGSTDGTGPAPLSANGTAPAAKPAAREGSDEAGPAAQSADHKADAAADAASLPDEGAGRQDNVADVEGTGTPPRKQKRKKVTGQDRKDMHMDVKEVVAGKKKKKSKTMGLKG